MPGAKENAEVALEMKVPVINISLGKGDWIVEGCHNYGGKVIATVVNEKHAKSAINMGCDALMVTGHEAAAHGGDVGSFVLVPCMTSKWLSNILVLVFISHKSTNIILPKVNFQIFQLYVLVV